MQTTINLVNKTASGTGAGTGQALPGRGTVYVEISATATVVIERLNPATGNFVADKSFTASGTLDYTIGDLQTIRANVTANTGTARADYVPISSNKA